MPFFITPDGVKLNYLSAGEGKPLVFLHGWAMCSRVWKYQLERFSKDYQVIALDLRGHGESHNEVGECTLSSLTLDIIHLIEGLQLQKVTLVGWSLGVSLILKLCSLASSHIDSLVLVDGTPALVARGDFPYGLPPAVVKRMLRLIRSNFTRALSMFYQLLLSDTEEEMDHREEVWDLLTDSHYLPHKEVASALLMDFAREDLRGELGKVTVPVLLVHGGKDRICLPGAARYMREQLKNAEILFFPEAGHAPFLTHAEFFNIQLKKFLVLL